MQCTTSTFGPAHIVVFLKEIKFMKQQLSLYIYNIFFVCFIHLKFREDGTIETALPLPAPFAGGSSGATPFTPGHFIDAPPPECPLSLVEISPRPLPRKPGLKGGVPFSPLDLISQFVPVPLPFITNIFFRGPLKPLIHFFIICYTMGTNHF